MKIVEHEWKRPPDGGNAMRVSVTVELPEVGELALLDSFNPAWIRYFPQQVFHYDTYLPTEKIVRGNEVPECRRGRVFNTRALFFGDKVMSYDDLHAHYVKLGEQFPGTSAFEQLMMVEVYEDRGDDGHTDYRLVGYRFVNEKALEERNSWSGMMSCMKAGWKETDYGIS